MRGGVERGEFASILTGDFFGGAYIPMSVKELEAEIMRLAPKDQAYLFEKLIHVLEVDEEPLTNEELDRRANDLRTGRVQGIPAEEMMSSARRLL